MAENPIAPAGGKESGQSADPFRLALADLRSLSHAKPSWWLLPITAAAFIVIGRVEFKLIDVLTFSAAIAVHESGHYLAMRILGYRDVRVFFLPLIGAATTGTREDAEAWERVVVSLAGPLPGLLAALVLSLSLPDDTFHAGYRALTAVLLVNGFNLLPLEPLDGGRVVGCLLFSRSRWLETAFGVASGVGLAAIGLALSSALLTIFGVLILALAPARHELRVDAVAVAERFPTLTTRIEDNDEVALRGLYNQAMRMFYGRSTTPRAVARRMRAIHQRAVQRPAGVAGTLGWMLVYFACLTLAVGTTLMFVSRL